MAFSRKLAKSWLPRGLAPLYGNFLRSALAMFVHQRVCVRVFVGVCLRAPARARVSPFEIKGEFLIYKSLKMWKFSCYLTSFVVQIA